MVSSEDPRGGVLADAAGHQRQDGLPPVAITRLAFVNKRFAFARLSLSVPCKSSFAILSFSYGAMTATMSPSHFGHRIFAGRSRTTSRQEILQFRHRNVAVSFSRRALTAMRVAWSAR